MSAPQDPNITFYGFTPVVRDPDVLFRDHPTASGDHPKQDPFVAKDFPLPDSPLVQNVKSFVQKELDEQTYNHSNRVYIYGVALTKTHFPSWTYDLETYYLACLLHDIGTAQKYLATTKMSFEFKGAIVARDLILSKGGVEDQADSVCDAIVRHQDIFVKGFVWSDPETYRPTHIYPDNVGIRANLIHPNLVKTTCDLFPRKGWSDYFARVIEKELSLKPWCHSTTFEQPGWKEGVESNFARDVRGNEVMHPFD
ncbi:hypothetical protein D9758_006569 [Tetrapyrgos nigripes]|uniref:HD domain-containing protein n=1 Tax=Tetrapyrgos nigripes TaxID=182062 RepID=A0A8H5GKN6_9AGAR|nr:hypothetical protein D9758_006569 [Tetrapyrgos nigripes]